MKKIILGLCFCISSLAGFSQKGQQVLGVQFGGMVPTTGMFNEYRPYRPQVSPVAGIAYDVNFTRRVGISVAGLYRYSPEQMGSYSSRIFDDGLGYIHNPYFLKDFSYLEAPVNLALNLDWKETTAFKTYFVLGYTYSRLIHYNVTDSKGKNIPDLIPKHYGLQRDFHYLNAGVEIRHNFKEKYVLAFGPQVRFLINEYSDVGYLGFNLKVGRVL
ncbi:hypothetical protein [Adhaeribacter soli]|uniref:Outer membrane protein beta-barrel domain-containing protein n=1 Tax=Adhaeribacter soli TaxID=2607655 RepID=A0A5N1JAT1_9BACT|nr:hypothetical protein [Adhaeribacter soli]KAA9345969.1 hypothetical protein F0P94_02490 [Adhaeribacter soli]